ncbi:MAG: 50S ribosomal protein L4 [Kiritimatiellae bacterium]|jgi:large subunit ribosomal protein L4|nr:50S ribosomal protein L4 [Kiritimatiellia bacterium]
MSTIKLFNSAGDSTEEISFADEKLELEKGSQAVKDTVVAWRNARRVGTACTKSKGEVAGSNKKPWRQKGTGRARAGYRQSPVWRGGAVAFGPKPRDFSQKINKKVAKLAFSRALSEKINDGQISVIDRFDLADAKTKTLKTMLAKMGFERSVLIVVDEYDEKLTLASRNLQKVEVATAVEVSVYSLLLYRNIVASKAGFDALTERMSTTEVKV